MMMIAANKCHIEAFRMLPSPLRLSSGKQALQTSGWTTYGLTIITSSGKHIHEVFWKSGHCNKSVDDTFIIWNKGDKYLKELDIKFTMEEEKYNILLFLDALVTTSNIGITISVYKKPTHSELYLNFTSNHLQSTKHGITRTLQIQQHNH